MLVEKRFYPDTVKKAVLWWYEHDFLIWGIEMFDKNNKSILRVGDFDNCCKKHSVVLEEGERIVGIASNYNQNGEYKYFQFIISKLG